MADYVSNYSGDQIDKAVGRALPGGALDTGKAPAGFGLGEIAGGALTPDTVYTERRNGTYVYYDGAFNNLAPGISSARGTVVISGNSRSKTLTFYNNHGHVARRYETEDSATYGEWEYVNPPMELGVEYRTTERYLGKPVYVCVKEFTGLTNGANFSTGITNGSNMVRYHARWTSVSLPFINQQDLENSWSIYLNASNVNIMSLWYGADTFDTAPTLTVTMYYTKSTD